MNKDVLISIKGMHFDNSENGDDIEVIQKGQYYYRGGNHYLVYDEPVVGSGSINKNMIKFNNQVMTVTKRGIINTSLLFDSKEKNLTNYSTPFGNILLGIDTKSVCLSEEKHRLLVDVNYSLDVNYEYLADCDIHIEATDLS